MKNERKFELGEVLATRGVAEQMSASSTFSAFCYASLRRHAACDWGDLSESDKQLNEEALDNDSRIMSAYEFKPAPSKKIWIITEADRNYTTILFPDEY